MNTPTITTRIADLIRNPNSAMPNAWEYSKHESGKVEQPKAEIDNSTETKKTKSTEFSSEDTLSLSPLAQKILEESDSYDSEWEKVRNERVQRVQQLVQEKQYSMPPEAIDDIAQKIVNMFT